MTSPAHADGHHTTSAPLIISGGLALIFIGLTMARAGEASAFWGLFALGLLVFFYGFGKWLEEYLVPAPEENPSVEDERFASVTPRKFGTWVFLLTEMMVFGTLFSTYLRFRLAAGEDWTPAAQVIRHDLWPGIINTFLLITSSLTVVMGLYSIKRGDRKSLVMWLTVTFVLGLAFLVLKAYEWNTLINGDFSEIDPRYAEGFWLDTSMEGTTFFVTTGAHGAHVFGGLVALLFLIYKAQKGGFNKTNHNTIEYFGLYWHFVDIVWVFVFPFFYLF